MYRRQHNATHRSALPAGARTILRGVRMGLGAAQTASMAQILTAAANAYGVDPQLAIAVGQRESGLKPNLVNSRTGAAGLMQLMPATAASLGVTNIMDPTQNANAGVKYLAQLLAMYGGDTAKAVAAYDWGLGNLNNAISQYGDDWLSHAPTETQNYVAALTGETPGQAAAQQQTVLTIDPDTGDVLDSSTVDESPVVQSGIGNIDPQTLMLLAAGVIGLYLLDDFLG